MNFSVFIPPRSTDLPPAGGVLGPSPEHFFVEEIPAYPLSGKGEHVFVFVEKVGLNTTDVARRIADAAGQKARDVGYAGMKDKNAVTRQWFSVCTKAENAEAWDLGEGARVLSATRHDNKLRTGHLIGNRFTLTFVSAGLGAPQRATALAAHLSESGLPNYFGPQRFGFEGRNLSKALGWLKEQSHETERTEDDGRRRNRKRPRKDRQRFDNKLLPSVIQSEFFNRYVHARLLRPEILLPGEVVRLDGTGKCFVVQDLNHETPRRLSGDLHLTGPMPGPKTLQAEAEALDLEHTVLRSLELTEKDLTVLGLHAPGTRRDLLIRPENLTVSPGEKPEEYCLSFSLPAGGYATNIAYELTGGDWNNPRPQESAQAELPSALD